MTAESQRGGREPPIRVIGLTELEVGVAWRCVARAASEIFSGKSLIGSFAQASVGYEMLTVGWVIGVLSINERKEPRGWNGQMSSIHSNL